MGDKPLSEIVAELRRLEDAVPRHPWLMHQDEGNGCWYLTIGNSNWLMDEYDRADGYAAMELAAALRNNCRRLCDELDAKDAEIERWTSEVTRLLGRDWKEVSDLLDSLKAKDAEIERLRAELQGMTAMRDEAMRQHADDVKRRTETERNQRVLDAAEFAKLIAENSKLHAVIKDDCDTDAECRRIAAPVLGASYVDGSSDYIPGLADIVERLCSLVDGFMAATDITGKTSYGQCFDVIREMRKKVTDGK